MTKSTTGVTADELSRLCRDCGLCCDGTLYQHVELSAAEAACLAPRATPNTAGMYPLLHPCPHHSAQGCTVYSQRPQRCQDYTCHLYETVADGQIPLAEARNLCTDALRRVERLREQCDIPPRLAIFDWTRENFANTDALTRLPPAAVLDLCAVQVLAQKYFLRKSTGAPTTADTTLIAAPGHDDKAL